MGRRPQIQSPSTVDGGDVLETFVNGPVNLHVQGNFVTLTFTHIQPNITDLLANAQTPRMTTHVRSRIVMPAEAILALRDLLNRVAVPIAPSTTTHQ